MKIGEFLVRQRSAHGFGDVEPRQRANAVAAFWVAERLVIGELGVAVGLDGFADDLGELVGGDAVSRECWPLASISRSAPSVNSTDSSSLIRPMKSDGKLAKTSISGLEAVGNLLVGGQSEVDVGIGLGNHGEDFIALGLGPEAR